MRGESSEGMYCAREPPVLSLSLQDTMANGGRRRPERKEQMGGERASVGVERVSVRAEKSRQMWSGAGGLSLATRPRLS